MSCVVSVDIIELDVNHNHPTNGDLYRLYPTVRQPNQVEIAEILRVAQMGANVKSVVKEYNDNTSSQMTNKDFYNALRKAQKSTEINFDNNSGMGKQERKFSQVVSRIKSNPDNEVHVNTVDGSMEACFITLKSQREWFEKYPDIIHLDATYKICMENFILYIFLAQDKNLAGVPIAFCLMKTETTGNMEFMYKMFSELFDAKKIKVIMIDKDLQNIEILKRFFLLIRC
jgi:hypothetical protein